MTGNSASRGAHSLRLVLLAALAMTAATTQAATLPDLLPTQALTDPLPSPAYADDDDRFGTTLAVSGDTMVVGVRYDDVDGVEDAGAAYVYRRQGGQWALQQRLVAPACGGCTGFGHAVAIDGDRVLVGVMQQGSAPLQHAAFEYTRDAARWTLSARVPVPLLPAPGLEHYQGGPLALSGDRAIVGSTYSGRALMFQRVGGAWQMERAIVLGFTASYGFSVALDGGRAVLGIPVAIGPNDENGVLRVFEHAGAGWNEVPAPTASAGGPDAVAPSGFGSAVALDGDRLLVGAYTSRVGSRAVQGAAYLFERVGQGNWLQRGNALVDAAGRADDRAAASVDLLGDVAIAGSLYADLDLDRSNDGMATIFQQVWLPPGGQIRWTPATLLPGPPIGLQFGISVALGDGIAVAGIPGLGAVDGAGFPAGRGEIATRSGDGYAYREPNLRLPDGRRGDRFGRQVAVDGDTAIIGMPGAFAGGIEGAGQVQVFRRRAVGWTFDAAIDGVHAGGELGRALALESGVLAVGAPGTVVLDHVAEGGEVQIYVRSGAAWTLQATLQAPWYSFPRPRSVDGYAPWRRFGSSVAFDEGAQHLFVGEPGDADRDPGTAGAVHVYRRNGANWTWSATLQADDASEGDLFGASLLRHGGVLMVGAPGVDRGGIDDRGAVFAFEFAQGQWQQRFELLRANADDGDRFGHALVAAGFDNGDVVAIASAPRAMAGRGALVRIRALDDGSAEGEQIDLPARAGAGDGWGESLGAFGDTGWLVGAPGVDDGSDRLDAGMIGILQFVGPDPSWELLSPDTPVAGGRFGRALAAQVRPNGSAVAFAGAADGPGADVDTDAGLVEVFEAGWLGDAVFRDGFEVPVD